MLQIDEVRRLKWACKRGMLELDLVLEPFLQAEGEGFSNKDRERFERLLTESDPVLYSWLIEKSQPQEEALNELVQRIINFHRNKARSNLI